MAKKLFCLIFIPGSLFYSEYFTTDLFLVKVIHKCVLFQKKVLKSSDVLIITFTTLISGLEVGGVSQFSWSTANSRLNPLLPMSPTLKIKKVPCGLIVFSRCSKLIVFATGIYNKQPCIQN